MELFIGAAFFAVVLAVIQLVMRTDARPKLVMSFVYRNEFCGGHVGDHWGSYWTLDEAEHDLPSQAYDAYAYIAHYDLYEGRWTIVRRYVNSYYMIRLDGQFDFSAALDGRRWVIMENAGRFRELSVPERSTHVR